jgi:hypothetical protein
VEHKRIGHHGATKVHKGTQKTSELLILSLNLHLEHFLGRDWICGPGFFSVILVWVKSTSTVWLMLWAWRAWLLGFILESFCCVACPVKQLLSPPTARVQRS